MEEPLSWPFRSVVDDDYSVTRITDQLEELKMSLTSSTTHPFASSSSYSSSLPRKSANKVKQPPLFKVTKAPDGSGSGGSSSSTGEKKKSRINGVGDGRHRLRSSSSPRTPSQPPKKKAGKVSIASGGGGRTTNTVFDSSNKVKEMKSYLMQELKHRLPRSQYQCFLDNMKRLSNRTTTYEQCYHDALRDLGPLNLDLFHAYVKLLSIENAPYSSS